MSRENILNNIKNNKPKHAVTLPSIPDFGVDPAILEKLFIENASANKMQVHQSIESVDQFIKSYFADAHQVYSNCAEFSGNVEITESIDPHELENLDVVILKSDLGVADSGAIWLDTSGLLQRVIPFITQHLVIILSSASIVSKMHHAYELLQSKNIGYGVFIAGPSKTADIEQTLVIGAHGPLSMHVIIQ